MRTVMTVMKGTIDAKIHRAPLQVRAGRRLLGKLPRPSQLSGVVPTVPRRGPDNVCMAGGPIMTVMSVMRAKEVAR